MNNKNIGKDIENQRNIADVVCSQTVLHFILILFCEISLKSLFKISNWIVSYDFSEKFI